MTNKQALEVFVKRHGIRLNTVSLYTGSTGDDSEAYFGTCDITGIKGDVAQCTALDNDDNVVVFEAGTWCSENSDLAYRVSIRIQRETK